MGERGTSYVAEIETPSGLTFHASVYVPPDAEYDDMHELVEVAQAGAARMVGMAARVARAEQPAFDEFAQAPEVCGFFLEIPSGALLECARRPHGAPDTYHRTRSGVMFSEPPPL